MDVNTTYALWIHAHAHKAIQSAATLRTNIQLWVLRGGFHPKWTRDHAVRIMGPFWVAANIDKLKFDDEA